MCDNMIYFYVLSIGLLISIQNPKGAYVFLSRRELFLKRSILYSIEYHLENKRVQKALGETELK